MKKRILLVGVMILTGAISAFGQAAAESVMIHSMSAGAGAKAGTSLGRSTQCCERTRRKIRKHHVEYVVIAPFTFAACNDSACGAAPSGSQGAGSLRTRSETSGTDAG